MPFHDQVIQIWNSFPVIAPDIETLTSIPHYSHKVTKRFEVQGDSDVKIKNGMLDLPKSTEAFIISVQESG